MTEFVFVLVPLLVYVLIQGVAALIDSDTDSKSNCEGYFAHYGEWCSQDGSPHRCCSSTEHLTCEESQCVCKSGYAYVDVWPVRACEVEPSEENRWSCKFDDQCHVTTMGKYSRCHFRTCECYDVDGKNRATVEQDNVCRLLKKVGDPCEGDDECNWTIGGEARCVGVGGRSAVGTCECADGFFFEKSVAANECLQLRSVNQTCRYNIQCIRSLGELSTCSSEGPAGKGFLGIRRDVCQCSDTKNPYAALKTEWYRPNPNPHNLRGHCYYVKAANDTCATSEECMLGYQNPRAVCAPHDSYNGEHVCQCRAGLDCEPDYSDWNGARRSNLLGAASLASATLLLLIGLDY